MPEPINYMGMYPQANPLGGLMQGLQAGTALKQVREQALAEQQAQDLQAQFRSSLQDYFSAPSPDKLLQMQVQFPQMKDAFAPLIANMDKKQLQGDLSTAQQVSNALGSGNIDLAGNIVDKQIEAFKNSGLDTSTLENIRDAISTNPTGAKATVDFAVASLMGPEKYAKLIEAQGKTQEQEQAAKMFPSKLREQEAKTKKEEVEAKYIEPKTLQDIEYKGIQTKSLLADIGYKKQMAQIAAMNAATAREGNSLKREELKLKVQEKIQSLNEKAQQKASEVSGALDTNNNILNSIDRILSVPKNVREAAHGPISSKIPTLSSATADYEALMDTLGSQAFLNQVQSLKGMGALSDAEGKKLQAGMQNLSLTQSAKQAEQNIREMQKLVLKARKNIELKYGIKAPPPSSEYKSEADSAAIFAKYGIK